MAHRAKVASDYLHTAIRVRDLEAALRFYRDVVGLQVQRVAGDPDRPNAVWVDGIQLIRAEGQDTSHKGVLDHIGLAVTNIEEIVASIEASGVVMETPVTDVSHLLGQPAAMAFFRDPEGNKIELVQRG
jgi:lactoylglutathione lyase